MYIFDIAKIDEGQFDGFFDHQRIASIAPRVFFHREGLKGEFTLKFLISR